MNLIAPALLKAQKELVNPVKNAKNPHFGNHFADLGAVLASAEAALNDNDIVILQPFAPAPAGSIAVTTLFLHKSGQWLGGTATATLARDDPQGHGSAATYLKRYGASALLGMSAEDDDDAEAASTPTKKNKLF